MRHLRAWAVRFLDPLRRERREREFSEELESHLQMDIEDGVRSGLSPAEAKRQALLRLGGVEATKENYRDRRGLPMLETTLRDLAYAARMIRRSPGFSAAVIVTLALGIGATTAIFTVVNGVLLRPLPYPEPDRLVYINVNHQRGAVRNVIPFTYTADYAAWKRSSKTLATMAGYIQFSANLASGDDAERVRCALATQSLFPMLGARPLAGRTFLAEEDRPGGPAVAVLGEAFWKRRFHGDPHVAGKTVTLDATEYTIVGVLPANFRVPDRYGSDNTYDVWVPFAIGARGQARRGEILMQAIGRLAPGASISQSLAELDTFLQANVRRGVKKSVVMMDWHEQVAGGVRRSLVLFLFAVGIVLLIACVNVANLLLSRAASREKEMAVRRALGAGRGRVLRQLLTESVLLSLAGGLLGLALAFWVKNVLVAFLSPNLPTIDPIALDYRVLAFNFALAVLTGVAFGLAPGVQAARVKANDRLKDSGQSLTEGHSNRHLRNVLVVVEIGMAVVLLSGAGLLFKTFLRLRGAETGFRTDHMLTFEVNLTPARYPKAPEQARFVEQVLARIQRLPGVESAAAGGALPLTLNSYSLTGITVEGQSFVEADISMATMTVDYFRTMRIPIVRGRAFNWGDRDNAPGVAIVNESFVRRFVPDRNGLGVRIENPGRKNDWLTIVGIAADIRPDPQKQAVPEVYRPYLQDPGRYATYVVRSTGNPLSLAGAVRRELSAVDKTQPAYGLMTLDDMRAEALAPRRVITLLVGIFAGLALVLGAIGIYGVMAFSVGRRTHEIGVRMALGARQRQIQAMVLRRGAALIAGGIAAGLAGSIALTRLIANQLWGVSATDPATLAAVAVVLAATGLAACSIPARRAARVNPTVALKYE